MNQGRDASFGSPGKEVTFLLLPTTAKKQPPKPLLFKSFREYFNTFSPTLDTWELGLPRNTSNMEISDAGKFQSLN